MAQEMITLDVVGMTCDGCVSAVQRGLKRLEGVIDADVNLEHNQAHITYDAARLQPADLIERVRLTGYDVKA